MGEITKTPAVKTTTGSELPKSAAGVTNVKTESTNETSDSANGTLEKTTALSTSQTADHDHGDTQAKNGVIYRPNVQEYRKVDDFLFFCFQPLSW